MLHFIATYLFEVISMCSNVLYTLEPHLLVITLTTIYLESNHLTQQFTLLKSTNQPVQTLL